MDQPEAWPTKPSLVGLGMRLGAAALVVGLAGWAVAQAGIALTLTTGLSETAVGTVLTAVSTSLPELVTVVAAVRRGALTLAVSGVLGGNAFDTLLVAFSDMAYGGGSVFHALTDRERFLTTMTILMTGVLLMGLVRRQERGIANIGFESLLLLILYGGTLLWVVTV